MAIRVVCCVCREVLAYKDCYTPGVKTSHGWCEPCLREHCPEVAEEVIESCKTEPRPSQLQLKLCESCIASRNDSQV